MDKVYRMILFPLAAAAIAALGCDSAAPAPGRPTSLKDVQRESSEALGTAQQYAFERKEEYLARARTQWDDLSRQFDQQQARLSDKLQQASDDAKPRIEAAKKDLDAKKAKAQAEYERLKSSTADAWKDVQGGAVRAFDEFKHGLNDAAERYRE
jgi:gas vesicle protein